MRGKTYGVIEYLVCQYDWLGNETDGEGPVEDDESTRP